MRIILTATGVSPLLMHNPQMVDPEFSLNREIKALTGKRRKTEDDLHNIERLEWFGGLYLDTNGNGKSKIVQPTAKIRKSCIEAARISKQGKAVERALNFTGLNVPLVYQGPADPDELWAAGDRYISRLSVGIGQKRVMRCRPKFFPWAMSAEAIFLENVLDLADMEAIASLAGQAIGIGDNRVNGYGRFTAKIEVCDA